MTACNRRGILYMRDSQYSPKISVIHTSLITLTNSEEDPGCFYDTKSFILVHKFSIGFKSGLFPGQSRILM